MTPIILATYTLEVYASLLRTLVVRSVSPPTRVSHGHDTMIIRHVLSMGFINHKDVYVNFQDIATLAMAL